MVRSNSFVALVCFFLFSTVLSLPAAQVKRATYTHPIGKTDPKQYKFQGSPPAVIEVTADILNSIDNLVEAPPSLLTRDIPNSFEECDDLNSVEARDTFNPLSARGIIGTDNRVLLNSTDFPYSAMGKVVWSDGTYCTGTLVGTRHVATARHCAPLSGQAVTVNFYPDYFDGQRPGWASSGVSTVLAMTGYDATKANPSQCDYKEDWAILVLSTELGTTRGYLGVKTFNATSSLNQASFYHFGYPYDLALGERSYRQYPNTVSAYTGCDAYGPLVADTDTGAGQSGGPLWSPPDSTGLRYTYGVLSASSATNTLYGGGNNFVAGVAYVRTTYP